METKGLEPRMETMLPLELQHLSQKRGLLSPGLVLGFRIGEWVRRQLGPLTELRIAAGEVNDISFTLNEMVGKEGLWGGVTRATAPRDWDLLFYQPSTNLALTVAMIEETTRFPTRVMALEPLLVDRSPAIADRYRQMLGSLIHELLHRPLTTYCQVRQVRCQPFMDKPPSDSHKSLVPCPGCGSSADPRRFWIIDGQPACPDCFLLEPSWFMTC